MEDKTMKQWIIVNTISQTKWALIQDNRLNDFIQYLQSSVLTMQGFRAVSTAGENILLDTFKTKYEIQKKAK